MGTLQRTEFAHVSRILRSMFRLSGLGSPPPGLPSPLDDKMPVRGSKLLVTFAAAGLTLFALFQGSRFLEIRRLNAQVEKLEQEKADLLAFARRLSASRRVAQVEVLGQYVDTRGDVVNLLSWQEVDRDGLVGAPLQLMAVGNLVYFEGAVIKFDYEMVGQGDTQRGTSLVLFRRVFGDRQVPAHSTELDRQPPLVGTARPSSTSPSNGAPAPVQDAAFADRLWAHFWSLIEDAELARKYDVRVAQIEAPAVPLRSGEVWEVTLDAAGGLNLRRLGHRHSAGAAGVIVQGRQ